MEVKPAARTTPAAALTMLAPERLAAAVVGERLTSRSCVLVAIDGGAGKSGCLPRRRTSPRMHRRSVPTWW